MQIHTQILENVKEFESLRSLHVGFPSAFGAFIFKEGWYEVRAAAYLLLASTSQARASGLLWVIVLFSLGTCKGG